MGRIRIVRDRVHSTRSGSSGPRAASLVAALSLVVAACGSTVALDDTGDPASGTAAVGPSGEPVAGGPVGSDGGLTFAESGAAADLGGSGSGGTGTGVAAPVVGGGDSGDAPGSRPGGPSTSSGAGTGSAPRGGGGSKNLTHGPGVTDKTITIGLAYHTGTERYQAALGNTAYEEGDQEAQVEAVLRDINKNGGAAGRQLRVIYHTTDANDPSPHASKAEAACVHFTQDNKVLLGIKGTRPVTPEDNFVPCMARAGSVAAGLQANLGDRDYARLPTYYDLTALATDHAASNMVDALAGNRYFTGWDTANGRPGRAPVKVGIVAPDKPDWVWAVHNVLVPELARHGHKVAADNIAIWQFPKSTSDNGQAVSQIQSAVLRFRSDGVTHVLPVEQNSSAFFASGAEGQKYRPRYGINSYSNFQGFAGTLVPYEQMNGAVGVGWIPQVDLPPSMTAKDTGPYAGPGQLRCVKVMKKAGITFAAGSTAKANALATCDALYSAQQVLNSIPAGTAITASSYMAGVEGLRDTFRTAVLPAALFGPGRHYPVTRGWAIHYVPDCQCMRYKGKPYKLR